MNVPVGKEKKKWPSLSCIVQFVFCCSTKEVNYTTCVLAATSVILFGGRPSGDEGRLCLLGNYG